METLLVVLSVISTFNIGIIVGLLIGYMQFNKIFK